MSEEKKKILIIDDERAFSVMLQLNLSSWEQYEVIIENDSRNALKTALQFIPDLVLLDVIMPHLEGPDVAGQFKIKERDDYGCAVYQATWQASHQP
jgi:DNA-binding response OmpR family regulator